MTDTEAAGEEEEQEAMVVEETEAEAVERDEAAEGVEVGDGGRGGG